MENTPEGNLRGAAGQVPQKPRVVMQWYNLNSEGALAADGLTNTYQIRLDLKALGFKWNPEYKSWVRENVEMKQALEIFRKLAKICQLQVMLLLPEYSTPEIWKQVEDTGAQLLWPLYYFIKPKQQVVNDAE